MNYDRTKALADISAGLILTAVLIPQAMSYATLANLDPVHGLYCSILPPIVYAIFGTYRHLNVGSFALVSLMFGEAILNQSPTSEEHKLAITMTLTFIVGCLSVLLGICRVGSIDVLMSDACVSGVYASSGITIATSQLKFFLGLSIPRYEDPFSVIRIWGYVITHITDINPTAFCFGFLSLAFLVTAR